MKTTGRFNPEMVLLARAFRGLSQADLSEALGATQSKLSRIENGLYEPDAGLVGDLADSLRFPERFFFQSGSIHGLPVRHHRRRKQISKATLDRIHAEITLRTMHITTMLQAVELESKYDVPEFDLDDLKMTPGEVAGLVRERWGLPRGPIKNVTTALEDAGVLIIPCNFGVAELDAVGVRPPGLPPLMFVNDGMPVDRMRFTMAHELGHLILHSIPRDDMEIEADQFASEFLMPAEDIFASLLNLTLQSLALLKTIWRVSMGALVKRAKDLRAISEATATRLFKQFSKFGWRRREPSHLDLSPEPPTLLRAILGFHLGDLQYTVDTLGQVLSVHVADLKELYPIHDSPLRLVG